MQPTLFDEKTEDSARSCNIFGANVPMLNPAITEQEEDLLKREHLNWFNSLTVAERNQFNYIFN